MPQHPANSQCPAAGLNRLTAGLDHLAANLDRLTAGLDHLAANLARLTAGLAAPRGHLAAPRGRLAGGIAVSVVLLAACDPGPSRSGALNRGNFEYVCAGENDAGCRDFVGRRFPERFAVGGVFSMTYAPDDDLSPLPTLEAGAPEVLLRDGESFYFDRPGTVAVLALRGDAMVDYVHLNGEKVGQLALTGTTAGLTEIHLGVGAESTLTVEPRGRLGQQLAGTLGYTWQVAEPGLVELLGDPTRRSMRIRALAPGRTEVAVTARRPGGDDDGFAQAFPIIVGSSDASGTSESRGGTTDDATSHIDTTSGDTTDGATSHGDTRSGDTSTSANETGTATTDGTDGTGATGGQTQTAAGSETDSGGTSDPSASTSGQIHEDERP